MSDSFLNGKIKVRLSILKADRLSCSLAKKISEIYQAQKTGGIFIFPDFKTSSLVHYAIKKCSLRLLMPTITEYRLKYAFPDHLSGLSPTRFYFSVTSFKHLDPP